jgi:hypothetical protein
MLADVLSTILIILMVIMVIMALSALTMNLWFPVWWDLKQWWRKRNKRLSDYPNLYSVAGLVVPSMHDVINSEHMHQVERRAWRLEVFGERQLTVSRLSQQLKDDIESRYYRKGMQNAYQRGSKVLLRYQKQRDYFNFDEESDDLYRQAIATLDKSCLICNDRGRTWGRPDNGMRCETDCECQKKTHKVFE